MRAPIALTSAILLASHLVLNVCASTSNSVDRRPPPFDEARDNGTQNYYPIYTFATEPSIIAPKTNWLQWDSQCDDGLYYFITPRGWGIDRPGPMILDWKGDMIWTKHFANSFGGQAYDFKLQQYQGQEYLTFWTGDDRVRGHGSGSYLMLNASYDIVHKINAVNDLTADLHEFLVTDDATALLTVYQKTRHDVSGWRTFNTTENEFDDDPNWIWDGMFQEVGIEQNNLIFEWRASDHIDLNTSYHLIGGAGNHEDPWDFFHINSIQKDELGNYLISARYTHSIYYIDGVSGDVLWTLGGKANQFLDLSDGFAINFAWQHDARFVPSNSFPSFYTPPPKRAGYSTALVSLFDNAAEDHNYEYGTHWSRGLLLEISYPILDDRDTPLPRAGNPSGNNPHVRKPSLDAEPLDASDIAKITAFNGTNPAYTVRVVNSYDNPSRVRSSSQGSVQILPQPHGADARVFVGYGLNAVFTEFESSGEVLCDAHFGAVTSWERGDIQSYRALKFPWSGWPSARPKIVISDDDVEAWVSWNGATEVQEWVLQVSDKGNEDDAKDWSDLERREKDGFETTFQIPERQLGKHRYLRVLALSAHGKVLEHGVSKVIDRGLLASMFPTVGTVLPEKVARTSGMTMLGWVLGVAVLGFAVFEACRKWMSYKSGSPAVGAVRWRKGSGYRFLGDV